MIDLKIDISKTSDSISQADISSYKDEIIEIQKSIKNKSGKGNEFLGWTTLPSEINEELISSIEADAKKIKQMADVFVVIGIGGSYLGSRAVIDALGHNFYELLGKKENPTVIFAGQNISEDYLSELLEVLDKKDYALTVISKSGTTTEPAIAFRILKNHLEEKYGKEAAKERIIAITDKEKGALKELALKEGYKTYIVPDDVGGRYSVLTPVGLLPIAVAGFDIRKLVDGALKMQKYNDENPTLPENPIAVYAACRNALYKKKKTTEILASYQPNLVYFTEWWKQLYGESEGKENKGIFPAGVNFTADLHSMGQYIQEGLRNIFETVISVENSKRELRIPIDGANLDSLNYLAGKKINEVNQMAEIGTMLAHVDGGVPNIKISIPTINEETIGELIYFFEMACAISGYILGVNPFDQPGVEAYKANMFALLGKPGFEKESEEIKLIL
ncbi:MAG: glucose-6-phosphate isomerase [Saprospiraceae bacterium]|nr:glucose-6-phosphate isomerase [Saprospiraceae bacterium]